MRLHSPPTGAVVVMLLASLAGCVPQQPFYFHEKGDLSRYIGMATEIDYPDVKDQRLSEVDGSLRPFSLTNSEAKEIWELSLEDAIRYALENGKVLRQLGGSPVRDFVTRTPELTPTIYAPAITETNARFGTEAALALFDAQWSTELFWEHNYEPRNPFNTIFAQSLFPQISVQDQAQMSTQIQKTNATGTVTAVRHNVTYDQENSPRLFPSNWTANLEVEIRQPLLQGAGVAFNRIAGPGAIPGFNQGVLLARINTDISLATFEANVRNMVSDVENAYWELYRAYRNLDAAVAGRNAALGTWRKVHALYQVQATGGEAATEAQAREQYFLFRGTVEQQLRLLYAAESNLRYMMGLAATDGRLIRPKDEPTTAKVVFDWSDTHAEALARNVELREEKWRVKQRELELIAAKNYLLPRLDTVARYRWLGLGDDLISQSDTESAGAYQNLLGGRFQDWHLGIEARVPLGFRRELSGVRNSQLSLARERAVLQEMELEVSHNLANAIRDLESHLVITQTNFNRRLAAQRQLEAVEAAYQAGARDAQGRGVTFDLVLQAQRLLAQAESEYYNSLVEYNRAITNVHFRKGSLLEYNGVFLAEGPWPGKAYFDAKRRARARDAGIYLDYGFTMPRVLSRGPYEQFAGAKGPCDAAPFGVPAASALPGEAIPSGEPEFIPSGEPVHAPSKDAAPLKELPPPPKAASKVRELPAPPKAASKPGATTSASLPAAKPRSGAGPTGTTQGVTKSRDLGSLDLGPISGKQAAIPGRTSTGETSTGEASTGAKGGAWTAKPVSHEVPVLEEASVPSATPSKTASVPLQGRRAK